jgi:magnesium transporter
MIDVHYHDGAVHRGSVTDLESLNGKKVWVDITNITREEAGIVRRAFNLHPLTEEDIYNTHVRIKVEEFPNYLFCAFYGVRKGKVIEPIEFDFILGENFVISNHEREVVSINELKSNSEKLESLFCRGCDFLFYHMLDELIDHYYPVLETFDEQIDMIEEQVVSRPKPELLVKILRLKRQIVQIKKQSIPQRDKIGMLAKEDHKFISEKARPYFRDIYDHAVRVSDSVENYREAISNTFEAYMSAVNNNLSEVMKVLTVISTVVLPLTVISSIYGTNFDVLPGAHHPLGFWFMIGLMLTMTLGMLIFFKRRNWF